MTASPHADHDESWRDLPVAPRPHDREWDRPPVLPALGLVLLGVVWLAFLIWPRPPAVDSADAGFLRDMIVHHNQAVRMAQIARDGTVDPEVDLLARDVADGQQVQVGVMFGWLEQWGLSPNNTGPAMAWMGMPVEGPMPGMATPEEMSNLQSLMGGDLDAEFLRLLARHHVGGVDMATACLDLCEDEEVVRLARNIAAIQGGEIALMNDLLSERGRPAVTAESVAMDGMSMAGMDMGGQGATTVGPSADEDLWTVLLRAIRALPIVFGLVALGWLVADSVDRRAGRVDPDEPPSTALQVGIVAAGASASLHTGLFPGFLELRLDLGIVQGVIVGVQATVVAVALADRRRHVALIGAIVGLAVITAWPIVRLIAPEDGLERYDLAMTLALVAEAIQAAAFFWAWRQAAEPAGQVGAAQSRA